MVLKSREHLYPPASKASREVANLTERKNPHTPVYGDKEFLSVCCFDPNYLRTGRTEWAEIVFRTKPSNKSLHVWLPELFLTARFCFKNS